MKRDGCAVVAGRVGWIDNLKIFLTVLVVFHHAGQAYGPTGGFWQYKNTIDGSWPWLGAFFSVNAAFFMGLFFLISGYFLPAAYERHGWKRFLTSKLARLGLPLLAGFLTIVPVGMYLHYSRFSGNPPLDYFGYFTRIFLGFGGRPGVFRSVIGFPEMNFGHLWFIQHLLLYSFLYVCIRAVYNKWGKELPRLSTPGMGLPILLACLIALVSVLIRQWYPVDTWVGFLGVIQLEPAHWPQYALLFTVGVALGEGVALQGIRKKHGLICLVLGMVLAAGVWFRSLWPECARSFISATWPLYESFLAVFLIFGLLVFFRERVSREYLLTRFLARHSYAVYILHVPVLLGLQVVLDRVPAGGAPGKFLLVGSMTALLSWFFAWGLLRIPGVKHVL